MTKGTSGIPQTPQKSGSFLLPLASINSGAEDSMREVSKVPPIPLSLILRFPQELYAWSEFHQRFRKP